MGSRFQKGINDLKTWCEQHDRTDLLLEWDIDKNGSLSPDNISYGSHKEVFWVCSKCETHYKKDIHARTRGTGCGVCSGVGKNQHRRKLFDEYPLLKQELDLNKNSYESLKDVSAGSSQPIYWICNQGHSYDMPAVNKPKSKGCPYCTNKRVLVGFNDLETWCKKNNRHQILDDWDYKKNSFSPSEITYGSNKKAWFKCHICGYQWQTVVISRTLNHTDCKMCVRRINSSFPEQCVYHYIALFFPDAINGDRTVLGGPELDVWVPSLKFAVEYDGKTWHKDSSKDINKDELCGEHNIALYRIREKGCNKLESNDSFSFEYEYGDWNTLTKIIIEILKDIGIKNPNVDITRDEYEIKEKYYLQSLADSLSNLYPNIASEWHPFKNGHILPDLVAAETHDQYYWLCPNGHTYKASVKNRVRMNSGCPYCSNQKILKGFNDLETKHPEIALDYDNQKNERKSYEVSRGCSDFVWFKCHKCGYEFNYQLNTYVNNGGLCPACSKAGKTKFKKVLNFETKELFDTLPLAAKSISSEDSRNKSIYKNIACACSGESATAYGYHWFYVMVDKNGVILDDLDSFVIKNTNKQLIGQTKMMKNGQKATVIRDDGPKDIDIQFEDGFIVCTSRRAFKAGTVRNPELLKKNHEEKLLQKAKDKEIQRKKKIEEKALRLKEKKIQLIEKQELNDKSEHGRVKTSIVGTICTMKTGETAVCIRDNGWNDIDIIFDDGTVVEHVARRNFLNKSIRNPNHILSFVGMKRLMKCGLICEIIGAKAKTDITVRFENGEIVEHTTLNKFNKGTVLTNALSHNYKYRSIGERKQMNCGEYATIIADRGAHDIDVQFDDGVIVKHRDRCSFDNGTIQHPKTKTNYVGKVGIMRNGMKATVIADNGWDNIDVQFEDGKTVYHKRRSHFDDGRIAHE